MYSIRGYSNGSTPLTMNVPSLNPVSRNDGVVLGHLGYRPAFQIRRLKPSRTTLTLAQWPWHSPLVFIEPVHYFLRVILARRPCKQTRTRVAESWGRSREDIHGIIIWWITYLPLDSTREFKPFLSNPAFVDMTRATKLKENRTYAMGPWKVFVKTFTKW